MVRPTTTLEAAHHQKFIALAVNKLPTINVARHIKYDFRLPILNENSANENN